ncbi:MAG: SGNH/GDSL hydrolase family protein [Acidobacteriota bacterium]|nr:SGNH/GDSL hydrolase family protein [Acidobacteriota bacterium]
MKRRTDAGRRSVLFFPAMVCLIGAFFQEGSAQTFVPGKSPRGIAAVRGPIFNPNLSENRYIGFGDSITYGTINHEDAPELGYIPRLDALLDAVLGPSEVVNEGLGGEETSGGNLRIGSVIAVRLARYILIMEGTNDVTFLRPVSTSIANLRSMISQSLNYGLLPVLATIVPRRDAKWYISSYQEIHIALNAAIRLLAVEMNVPLADMDKVFNDYLPGGPGALLSEDLKHPNETGYQVLAKTWAAAVEALPFPPESVRAKATTDKILFYRRTGNMVTWLPNDKTEIAGTILSYKIYRRKRGESAAAFQSLAVIEDAESYFDVSAVKGTVYEYVVAAVRTDGVEGPCSAVATLEL